MSDLATRLTMFMKDLDYYDYMDSMEIDETDEDMIEKNRQMLDQPILVRSAITVLEEVLESGQLEEDDIDLRTRCQELKDELKEHYRELLQQRKAQPERSSR